MGNYTIGGKVRMAVGAIMLVAGSIAWYVGGNHLPLARQQIAGLEGQVAQEEVKLASFESKVVAYWQGLRLGRVPAGNAQERTDDEQISAYCLTTSLFPETRPHADKGLCTMVDEAAVISSDLNNSKAQLAAQRDDLKINLWSNLYSLGMLGAVVGLAAFLQGLTYRKKDVAGLTGGIVRN